MSGGEHTQALSIECDAAGKTAVERLLSKVRPRSVLKNSGKYCLLYKPKKLESEDELAAILDAVCKLLLAKIVGIISASGHVPHFDDQLWQIVEKDPNTDEIDLKAAFATLQEMAGNDNGLPLEAPRSGSDKGVAPEVHRSQIELFVLLSFKYATAGNWVSLRAFIEKPNKPFKIKPVRFNGDFNAVIEAAFRIAKLAAQAPEKVVVCPPIATFTNRSRAREEDLAEGLVLSVECDAHPQEARKILEELLGPATLVVASGGMWENPETGELEPKLHLHFRLKVPARTEEEWRKLKLARMLATKIVDGDRSNITLVHPIRWPGSLHRKDEPKLCRIIDHNDDAEIELDTALAILQEAAGKNGGINIGMSYSSSDHLGCEPSKLGPLPSWAKDLDPNERLGEGIEASLDEIRAAIAAIPPEAIATEPGTEPDQPAGRPGQPGWHRLARAFAWEAKFSPERKDVMWKILDDKSHTAPGYDHDNNRRKFEYYISVAGQHETPITIESVFHMAADHGWDGKTAAHHCAEFMRGCRERGQSYEEACAAAAADERGVREEWSGRLEEWRIDRLWERSKNKADEGGDNGLGVEAPTATAPLHSEEALALAFAERHAQRLRYVDEWKQWLVWDGTCWRRDLTRRVFTLAREICREIAAKVKLSERKRIASAKTRAAVVSLAGEDRRLVATVKQWDTNPWLLNTPDGVVNLRTGKMREHRADDYMTMQTAVSPKGKCPRWTTFLREITGGDDALQGYLRRIAGYFLTGVTIEQELYFFYGSGNNGKGAWTRAVSGILHDFHCSTAIETFTIAKLERHPTELAELRGARLVTAAETEEGRRWAEARIKEMTGGDEISARFMHQNFFKYFPQFKLLFLGNHMPILRTINKAITRRFNRIPFGVTIPESQVNKHLDDELKAEWPGILAWMIEGCLEWQRIGMCPPQAVTDATYLESEDVLGEWIDECCERDANAWENSTTLFYIWKPWAQEREEYVGSVKIFSTKLEDRGEFVKRKKAGRRGFVGLRLKVKVVAEQALTSFLNHFIGRGHALYTDAVWKGDGKIRIVRPPIERCPVHVQVACSERKILISKKAFDDHLHKEHIPTDQVTEELIKFYDAKEVRLTLGAGTDHAVAQEAVVEIPIPPGMQLLEEMLRAHSKL
jgi:putative DNA primase/helicase